nr:protein SIEVE ELEMENT OCCLUSION B-like [Ipomoea trifida]
MATQPIDLSQPLISQPPTVTNMEVDDDAAISYQVMATHHPNAYGYGATNLNANFVLSYAENILNFNHLVSGEVEKGIFMPQKLIHKELSYQMRQLSFEAKRIQKSYEALLHAFSHSDNNLEVLKLIFNVNDDSEKIFEYTMIRFLSFNRRTRLDLFRRVEESYPTPFEFIGLKNKRVLLIIVSDTNLSEVAFLYHHLSKFDIIPWTILIPIIDYPHQVWSDARMPSLVSKGSLRLKLLRPFKRITPQFIRFVKERCVPSFQSGGEPIVISLDSRGRLVHTNALHMILTWRGALAYDMTVGSGNNIISLLQKELTEMTSDVGSVIDDIEEKKRDLVNHIRKTIDDWRNDINRRIKDSTAREYDIFFCGGNDVKCIQEFASKVKDINSEIQLDIKFAYIGNNKKAKSLVKNISDYALLSNNAEYLWFWTRLRSAFLSRINYLNKTGRIEDEDKIFLGLQKLLAYEAKSTTFGAWVLLSKGEEVVACDFGDKMMRVMNAYQKWKNNIPSKGFSQAFKDCYEKLASSQDQYSCCMLEYPLTLDKIPEDVKCPQGSHNMHKFVTFTCCHDCHSDYDDDDDWWWQQWVKPFSEI